MTEKKNKKVNQNEYDGRFDEISAAVMVIAPSNGKIISVNLEAEELTGYEAGELKKMRFLDIFADDSRQRINSLIHESKLETGEFRKLFEHNVIIRKRSKRRIIVDMGFHLSHKNDKPVFIFTLQDITDLKNSELQIRQANDYVTSILGNMSESVFVLDSEFNLQTVNQAGLKLLGYTEEGLSKQNMLSIFDGKIELKSGSRLETFLISKDGKKIPVHISISAIHESQSPLFILVAMDLTEKKKSERLIAEQQMQLVQASKMSSLGVMASGIAHEINNPLHVMNGHCEMLEMILAPDKKPQDIDLASVREGAHVIGIMVRRVKEIVTGLSTFSRDQRDSSFETVDVRNILKDTLLLCERRIRNAGIQLRLPQIDHEMILNCKPTQVSQVILNLLNNAYDEVEKGPRSDRFIHLEIDEGPSELKFIITNSGAKIDRKIADKLFHPFFTTKRLGKGTGLGLSISKSIIEDHGGEIYVDWDSKYTKFIVRIPRSATGLLRSA